MRTNLTFNLWANLQVEHLETAWIELLLLKTKPIIIDICYRPPKQQTFMNYEQMSCIKSNISMENELGDFNTNLLLPPSKSC